MPRETAKYLIYSIKYGMYIQFCCQSNDLHLTSQVVSSILATPGWEGPVGEGAGTRQASVQAARTMNFLDKLKTGLT